MLIVGEQGLTDLMLQMPVCHKAFPHPVLVAAFLLPLRFLAPSGSDGSIQIFKADSI